MGLPAPIVLRQLLGNYPPGPQPWNGQPIAVTPALPYHTPGTRPPAEEQNQIEGTITAELSLQRSYVGGMPAQNWGAQLDVTVISSASHASSAGWDYWNSRWLVVVNIPGSPSGAQIWTGYGLDGASLWTQVGATIPASPAPASGTAIIADPNAANVYWLAYVSDDGTNNGIIKIYKYASGSWTLNTTIGQTAGTTQRLNFKRIGTTLVMSIGNTSSSAGHNANAFAFFRLGDSTWSLAAQNITFIANEMRIASDALFEGGPGTILVAFPIVSGTVSGQTYWTTTDGVTWTAQTMPSLGASVPRDIVYTLDALGPCFLLATDVGGVATFYRSGDGVSWSAQSTPATPLFIGGMASMGSLVVATLGEAVSTGPSFQAFSVDGGVTWYFSQAYFSSSLSQAAADWNNPRPYTSNIGFLAINNLWLRQSSIMGLPPASL